MSDLWGWLVGILVWLSADPQRLDIEQPRAAAAVAAARASMAREAPAPPAPAPGPKPPAPSPSGCRCGCTNGKIKPDGRIAIPCECSPACTCKRSTACFGGKCTAPAR